MVLGQLGADVIRIDPVAGPPDPDRWPTSPEGTSYFWAGLNKGKCSVRVDIRSPRGFELFGELLRSDPRGGVLLTNVPFSGRVGGYQGLVQLSRSLIMAEMVGDADGTSEVDYTVQPATGFPLIAGPDGWSGPVNSPLPAWDLMLGLYSVIAIADSLARRGLDGQGEHLTIALSDVAFSTVAHLGRRDCCRSD